MDHFSPYLVVIVQPDPLQRHDLLGLLVLGLEHGAIGAWEKRGRESGR